MKKSLSPLPVSSASRPGRLMRCIRCPVAYHTGDSCVAAGSVVLTHHIMICSSHGSAKRNGLLTSPVNVGWCFLCARGKLSQLYTLTAFLSHSCEPPVTLNRQSRLMGTLLITPHSMIPPADFSPVTKDQSSYLHFILEHHQDLITLHDCSFCIFFFFFGVKPFW